MSILGSNIKVTETDKTLVLPDTKDPLGGDDINIAAQLSGIILERFNFAKTSRFPDEERWMRFWRNFRGIYSPQVKYTDTEKSTVFVKITKTKTIAAIGQIMEILQSSNEFPITIDESTKPIGIAESVAVSVDDQGDDDQDDYNQDQDNSQSPYGYAGDGRTIPAGATLESLVGPDLAEDIGKSGLHVKSDPYDITLDDATVVLSPAQIAAANMEKTIKDQLDETDAMPRLRDAVYETAILGTGCLKGALTKKKIYNCWKKDDETGQVTYDPIDKDVPILSAPSIWNIYPDPEATTVPDCSYIIERHGLNNTGLRALKDRPGFRETVIEYIIDNYTPNYNPLWFEHELKDFILRPTTNRYEVLEYWGRIDKKIAEKFGLTIPKEYADEKEVMINAFICCNQVIRFIINPFQPAHLPYMLCPYERNPYKIWGIGVPENMEDSQLIMNGHARMAIDNLALAGNVVFEIDETYMTNTEDMRIYPGRVFRRQGGPPGQAIYAVKFPATTQENMMMFDKFRQLADESTNIPSISHGQTGITGTTRTSSGMSMIMNASTVSIKTVVRNIDEFFIQPIGESFFAWNMQFNPDIEIKGDLEVKARGTSSLMQKEIRTQRLMMFMQVGANPTLAPFIKWYEVIREFAKDLEIEPDKFTNNIEEAKIQALIVRTHNTLASGTPSDGSGGDSSQPIQGPGGAPGVPGGIGGVSPQDSTGTGNGTISSPPPISSGEAGSTNPNS